MAYFNPLRPAYIENPYPILARLRREEPVHRSIEANAWVLTRYAECELALRDDAHFSSDPVHAADGLGERVARNRELAPLGQAPILGNSDPPAHTRLRGIVNRAYTPRAMEAMRPKVAAIVDTLLEPLASSAPFEVMSCLAEPLPVLSVLAHLGIPPDDFGEVRDWSAAIMEVRSEGEGMSGAIDAAADAARKFAEYLAATQPPDGTVLETLLEANQAGGMSMDEVVMLVIHISMAGNGPTALLLGNSVLALTEHAEQRQILAADSALIPAAIDEILRYDSPTHVVTRFVTAEVVLGGRKLRPGETVYVIIGAANRDPARFRDPDRFDICRAAGRQLSFGLGIHYCLGTPLARIEAELALGALVRKAPEMAIAPGGFERGGTFLLRGPKRLAILKGA